MAASSDTLTAIAQVASLATNSVINIMGVVLRVDPLSWVEARQSGQRVAKRNLVLVDQSHHSV